MHNKLDLDHRLQIGTMSAVGEANKHSLKRMCWFVIVTLMAPVATGCSTEEGKVELTRAQAIESARARAVDYFAVHVDAPDGLFDLS